MLWDTSTPPNGWEVYTAAQGRFVMGYMPVSYTHLGKTFDISFFWNRKRDYLHFRAEEEAHINDDNLNSVSYTHLVVVLMDLL